MIAQGESPESLREESETGFTVILRELRAREPGVLAAVFVDQEGECVDYAASLSAFDAKIVGAELRVLLDLLDRRLEFGGKTQLLEVLGETRDLLVRRLDEEYALVLAMEAGSLRPHLLEAVEEAATKLLDEAGLEGFAVPWKRPTRSGQLLVDTRPAIGWGYAPIVITIDETRTWIADVLGRWVEEDEEEGELVCFRVRTNEGAELTLVHVPGLNRWFERIG